MSATTLDKRLRSLEESTKPRLIATLADFVLWHADGCKEEVEFAPAMKEAFPTASRRR